MTKVCPVGLLEPWRLTCEPVELFLFRFQGCQQLYLLKSQSKGKILYCKCPDILPIYRNSLINKSAIRDSLLIVQSTLFQLIPLMQSTLFTCKLICSQVRKCSYLHVHVLPNVICIYIYIYFSPIQNGYWIFFPQFNFKGIIIIIIILIQSERILYSFQVFYIS